METPTDFTGKNIVITGSAGGLGLIGYEALLGLVLLREEGAGVVLQQSGGAGFLMGQPAGNPLCSLGVRF